MHVGPLLWLGLGLIAIVLFHADVYFSLGLSVLSLFAVTLFFLYRYRLGRSGLLILLVWLIYALPFVHIVPYLWFDFESAAPLLLWGMAINPYMLDQEVVALTAMIGAVGAIGIAFGASMSGFRIRRDYGLMPDGSRRAIHTMSLPIWVVWVIAGIALSWLAAPQDLLVTARYTVSQSALEEANFGSAWMMSYVILSFAFCDALLESDATLKRVKRTGILLSAAFVVIFLQLLRGDRAALPWVIALALIYYYWAVGFTRRRGLAIPWFKMGLLGAAVVVVSLFVGMMRHSLVGVQELSELMPLVREVASADDIGFTNLLRGTWSAVLLTPLSVAGDYVNDLLVFRYGRDYLDLILSIPPGFLADAVGYARPISGEQGPAWEMRYGVGGTHASVLPFRNFGMAGVFVIPAVWSYLVVRFEMAAVKKVSVLNLSLLATIVLVSAHWLWYGEKNGINGFILWVVLGVCYRISITFLRRPTIETLPENRCLSGTGEHGPV